MKDITRRCRAHRSSSPDQQCRNVAIPGGKVCRFHGGGAPQVRAKAQERIDRAADLAAAKLVGFALDKGDACILCGRTTDPAIRLRAASAVLDRAGIGPAAKLEIQQGDADRREDVAWMSFATPDQMEQIKEHLSALREIKESVLDAAGPAALMAPREDEDNDGDEGDRIGDNV